MAAAYKQKQAEIENEEDIIPIDAVNAERKSREVRVATGTATCVVALKHPTGIILEVFQEMEVNIPDGRGSMRIDKLFQGTGEKFPLHGNRVPFGRIPNFEIVNGYALTQNIPVEIWNGWLKQHKDHPLVQNNLINALKSVDDAKAFARDGRELRSGLEPMRKPNKDGSNPDPRTPKRRNAEGKFVEAIEPGDTTE